MERPAVTVVVCDLDADGDNQQIIVLEHQIDSREAIRRAKKVVASGWIVGHDLPLSVGEVIANAYDYTVHPTSVILGIEPL